MRILILHLPNALITLPFRTALNKSKDGMSRTGNCHVGTVTYRTYLFDISFQAVVSL